MEPKHIINFTVFKMVKYENEDQEKEEYYGIQWNMYGPKNMGELLAKKYRDLLGLGYDGVHEIIEYKDGIQIHYNKTTVWHEILDGKIFKVDINTSHRSTSKKDVENYRKPKRQRCDTNGEED